MYDNVDVCRQIRWRECWLLCYCHRLSAVFIIFMRCAGYLYSWCIRILASFYENWAICNRNYRVSQNIGPTFYLSFSRVLEPVQRNFWPLFNSPWNLLHNSHMNFENWFRNSLDNWHQSWHPSFWNWHFAITQSEKSNFGVTGANFDLNYLSYF